MKEVIRLDNIRRDFVVGDEVVHALRGISLTITEGEFVTIMGTSGSGKSTLLNTLGCLDTPTSGEYYLDGIAVRSIVEAFEKYLPEHHALFSGVMRAIGTDAERNVVEIAFSECRAISIDYGIMEKADNVYVRCGEFGWSDVGTWGSVYQHSRKDRYANAVPEEGCYLYDTRSSIVSLPKDKIAVISGLKEYIVVDTDDVLMVCPRSEEQNIKKFIDEVKFHNGDKHI